MKVIHADVRSFILFVIYIGTSIAVTAAILMPGDCFFYDGFWNGLAISANIYLFPLVISLGVCKFFDKLLPSAAKRSRSMPLDREEVISLKMSFYSFGQEELVDYAVMLAQQVRDLTIKLEEK